MEAARQILDDKGRLAVVSFHSLEDRIAKQFFAQHSEQSGSGVSRHVPDSALPKNDAVVDFVLPKKKKVKASKNEAEVNARSRSAVLRAGIKIGDATC
jgi:16S rRNA (cytosine1402-N4)-methyltransferase